MRGLAYQGFQDPSPLFEAMAQLPGQVILRFFGRDLGWLGELSRRAAVSRWVHLSPTIPYAECLAEMCRADALLLLLWNDPAEPGVFTRKLFDHLGARRPILAVGRQPNVASQFILEGAWWRQTWRVS